MNRYWDFSAKKRAALTREQVQACCIVELMEKGVLAVDAPVLQEEPNVVITTEVFYEIMHQGEYSNDSSMDIAFKDMADATAFVNLPVLTLDRRYSLGNVRFASPAKALKIAKAEYPTDRVMMNNAVVIKEQKAIREANKMAKDKYAADIKAVEEATKGVWDDWAKQNEYKAEYARIDATLAKYLELCAGDELLARANLGKAFDADTLTAREAWNATE